MKRAYTGADIFDGSTLSSDSALLLDGGVYRGVVPRRDIPSDYAVETLPGGTILPGFVDLQVNGGGGVLFNEDPSVAGLHAIAQAHATTGTRALLPTLITDTPARTQAAVDAVAAAIERKVAGIIGIHLEGPHLSLAKKGAHDPALIRPMTDADEAFLHDAARRLPNIMLTVAPENVTNAQITRLSRAGIIISLGHTDCSMADAQAAFRAGARCVTHLFNAMRQLGSREPGLVGAALDTGDVHAGLIADDIHVHRASMRAALCAKRAGGGIFLVTDAMATAGSDITEFRLNGRRVLRRNGRLTLEDGTLAGADLTFPRALDVLINIVGCEKEVAFSMATRGPACVLTNPGAVGRFTLDHGAQAIHLDDDLRYVGGL
ncbi:N-acetylglucosamine-6-phosphate deacetylase [Roseobacter denitrificans]|nr:N-acetylglucosamine-6-phosphate deacetylase [Roseobacter denitrificans]AVL54371.1 N-acetylglucosamine-6-phosphate deacetylase [Roseobacter denitrificans]SFF99816.1 N-acetylglucosamine 6-phosphate deacetylase [Roseobacter denitrificans OCh 114]